MTETAFSQSSTLAASAVLLFGIALLWRRGLRAYVRAFQLQSLVLSALVALVGVYVRDWELYIVAGFLLLIKVLVIPAYLTRIQERIGADRETRPHINIAASLVSAGLLVIFAYLVMRPLVQISALPTRGGLPLALGLMFVGLFVIITRRQALTQVIGFLVLENGIAMLAILGTFGIPLIIELGVFLDALLGFLVMQVFVYHIHGTFESIDVDQLRYLKH